MKRPRVIANFAISADGKVSTRNFTPTGFTSAEDKRRLREIRAKGDALLAGANTVRVDHMGMRLSDKTLQRKRVSRGQSPEPLRVIASNRGAIDPTWKVFRESASQPVIFSTQRMPAGKQSILSRLSDLWLFESESVDLKAMLEILYRDYAVKILVCEGGPGLFRALLEIEAVDELHLTWAPIIFGGTKAPTVTGLPGKFLPKIQRGRLKKIEAVGAECFLHYAFGN